MLPNRLIARTIRRWQLGNWHCLAKMFTERRKSTCKLSPELELLLLCAPLEKVGEQQQQRIRDLAAIVDWKRFLSASEFHRLTPLVQRHFSSMTDRIPEESWTYIKHSSFAVLAQNMRLTGEVTSLSEQFSHQGIPLIFFKGPITASQVYGQHGIRPYLDLDALVRRQDVDAAFCLLLRLGFAPHFELTATQRAEFRKRFSEMMFWNEKEDVTVDLHWELLPAGFSFSIPEHDIWKHSQQIAINECEARTLGDNDWLFYACIHASKHVWNRIIWLVDIAEWIRQSPEFDWDRLVLRAEAAGVQLKLRITFWLLATFFGIALPRKIAAQVESDPTTIRMATRVVQGWEANKTQSSWPHQSLQYLSYERAADKLRHLYKNLVCPTPWEWKAIPLPRALYPIYFVIRPFRLLYRRLIGAAY